MGMNNTAQVFTIPYWNQTTNEISLCFYNYTDTSGQSPPQHRPPVVLETMAAGTVLPTRYEPSISYTLYPNPTNYYTHVNALVVDPNLELDSYQYSGHYTFTILHPNQMNAKKDDFVALRLVNDYAPSVFLPLKFDIQVPHPDDHHPSKFKWWIIPIIIGSLIVVGAGVFFGLKWYKKRQAQQKIGTSTGGLRPVAADGHHESIDSLDSVDMRKLVNNDNMTSKQLN